MEIAFLDFALKPHWKQAACGRTKVPPFQNRDLFRALLRDERLSLGGVAELQDRCARFFRGDAAVGGG